MKKQRTLCIVTLICYFVFVVAGASIAISSAVDLVTLPEQGGGLGAAVSAFAMALLLILGILYAAFGVVPLILKAIHTFANKRLPAFICILFDVAYNICHAALLVSAIADSGFADPLSLILPLALLLLSLVALVTNALSLKAPQATAADGQISQ